ncbi:hypothetical protein ACRALDRAFT_2107237, partial [Sodiomyces alcalophilus JCM 7366]|uniref:uncharacterized protein n=1 Tax=Sodiomyces alcalophilus JCM 7366 TaxID=591952 RepID=UPI0039B3B215
VNYVIGTWIEPYKEKLINYFINRVPYFGNRTTFITESLYASLKRYIYSFIGDLITIFRSLKLY